MRIVGSSLILLYAKSTAIWAVFVFFQRFFLLDKTSIYRFQIHKHSIVNECRCISILLWWFMTLNQYCSITNQPHRHASICKGKFFKGLRNSVLCNVLSCNFNQTPATSCLVDVQVYLHAQITATDVTIQHFNRFHRNKFKTKVITLHRCVPRMN